MVANSAIRVVGRLDPQRPAGTRYGFLPQVQRQRATIVKPGTMLVAQPELPVPLLCQFPSRRGPPAPPRRVNPSSSSHPDDPFEASRDRRDRHMVLATSPHRFARGGSSLRTGTGIRTSAPLAFGRAEGAK